MNAMIFSNENSEKTPLRLHWGFCIFGGVENMDQMKESRRKQRAASLSVASNSLLVIGKVIVGIVTGSVGILSEAVHSGIDLLASGIAWWSVRKSNKPPDAEHTYGYGKVETFSAFIEALFIVGAALWILWEAIWKILEPSPLEALSWGIWIMGISAAVNIMVSRHLFRVGRETDSDALVADAHHLSADIWSSLGVLVGLGVISLTGWYWIDPLIAVFVGFWILRTGVKLSVQGYSGLIDTALPLEEEKIIHEIIAADPRVYTYHHLRSRKSGPFRLVDLHIHLGHDLSLAEAHEISHEIEAKIKKRLPKIDVVIHIEPCYDQAKKRYLPDFPSK